jgi:hypothetical protein
MPPMIDSSEVCCAQSGGRAALRRSIAVILVMIVAGALTVYPFAPFPLAIGLCAYGAIVYRYPHAWLIVLPALWPVLDLAPWSGWFFFEEFDFFILITGAVAFWRPFARQRFSQIPVLLRIGIGALAASYLASLLVGLFPLEPLDANAFANYFSRYNSLRVAKGFLWAILLVSATPTAASLQDHEDPKRLLNTGMILGLVALNLAVIYERFKFAGLFNFSTDLRAIATFSGLHNGGNDIEAYLVLASPFIAAWVFDRRGPGRYFFAAGVFALTSYSLLVTFSRGGYLGFVLAWIVLFACLLLAAGARSVALPPMRAPSFAVFLILLGGAVALPILKGDFIRARFATVAIDWQSRLDQLQNTFRMMDSDTTTSLFGMGLGRFPAVYLARQPVKSHPTVYSFESEPSNMFLRIKAGSPLYFGQWVRVEPGKAYVLSLDLRSVNRRGELSVPICEKQLQRSFRCQWLRFQSSGVGGWEHFERPFNTGEVGADVGRISGRLSRRPVELALYNAGRENILDIDNVKLLDERGANLLSNGNFSHGHNRWFFTVDDLMPWQSSNHWGQIFFEQGWFGLIAFNFFLVCVLIQSFCRIREGDVFSAVVVSGAAGFLTVGLFGSLFDTPRMGALFYFVSVLPFCFVESTFPRRGEALMRQD